MNWTERNIENFLSRLTFDFITQLEQKMESLPMTQLELAKKLNLSESRVSQILNGSHNLELKSIIKYARALGLKVAVVAYDDDDPENTRGLINSEIFSICWERQGKPVDYFALEESINTTVNSTESILEEIQISGQFNLFEDKQSATQADVNLLPNSNVVIMADYKGARATNAQSLVTDNSEDIAKAA